MEEINTSQKQILVINTMCIGDVILSTPALRVLKNNFPNSHLAMMVDKRNREVIEGNVNVDEIIPLDKKGKHKSIGALLELIWGLRGRNLDLVVNLSCNERSYAMTILSGAKKKVGYVHKGKSLFLDGKVSFKIIPQGKRHMADAGVDVLRTLNLDSYQHNGLEIFPGPEEEKFADHFLEENRITSGDLLIGVNAGATWPSKRWTKEGFASLADQITEKYGAKIIFFGGPGDREIVDDIVAIMRNKPIIATGKTSLRQLAALIRRCRVFITGDTGPMHIAVATKTPVIAIYGPSPIGGFSPYGEGHTIIRKEISCSPCGKHNCDKHECMKSIKVEEILEAVDKYLLGRN